MVVKRNIKKFAPKATSANVTSNNHQPMQLVGFGLGRYRFPVWDEVPEGLYYTKIIETREKITKDGRQAIEVFYEIQNAYYCNAIANGYSANRMDDKVYCIKQVYPKGEDRYYEFTDSMTEALGLGYGDAFYPEDVIGLTELARLTYMKGIDIGGFKGRRPFGPKDFKNSDKQETDAETDSEVETENEVEYTEDAETIDNGASSSTENVDVYYDDEECDDLDW